MSSPVAPKYGLAPILTPLIAIAALLVLSWPLLWHPTELLANPLGEGNNHYWMFWRALESDPVANLPEGLPIPLMDPVNLLFAGPLMWMSPAVAFNAVVVGNMLLAFAGAWALAWVLELDWRACIVAGVGGMAAPFLWGIVSFGITESLPVGWLALGVAALIRYGQQGLHRWWVLGGVCIGAFGLSGWYHVAFAVPVLLVLGPWIGVKYGRWLGLVGAAALVVAMTLPPLIHFLEVREFWAERWQLPPDQAPPSIKFWRTLPHRGTDLLNFFLPSLEREGVSKSVYLGTATLLLALAGGKRSRVLWAVILPLWVLALGFWLSVGGQTHFGGLAFKLPAGYLSQWIPQLQGISHWHRAIGPATPFLAVAAAMGAERLIAKVGWGWIPLVAILVLESALLSQTPWPRVQTAVEVPAVLQTIPETGGPRGLAVIPFDNARVDFSESLPRRYNLWQPTLDRPMAENYEGPDALLEQSPLLAAADGLCGLKETTPHPWHVPARLRDVDAARAAGTRGLAGSGVGFISLHAALCPGHLRAGELLEDVLGAPVIEGEGVRVWAVEVE